MIHTENKFHIDADDIANTSPSLARVGAAQRWSWKLTRLFLRTVGRASDGLRICFDEGLTAGTMLDYIYRNKPSGRWLIGPVFDRAFLEAPGWQAVREGRANLEVLLAEAIAAVRHDGHRVSLLDVASGPAGYVLEVLDRVGADDVFARCRDLDDAALAQGRAAADRRALPVVFEHGDALDRDAIVALRPRPNVAVASGFYDWISDDDRVQRSIAIVAEALQPGGWFVVTNQAAHPNLEFVSAVFDHFDHSPLRMKMRPAPVIEGWLRGAGLVVEQTLSDPHGYFSVTLARKRKGSSSTTRL